MLTQPLQLLPEYRDYVWGGNRLRPGQLTAEAWAIYENNRIASGPLTGQTLAQAATAAPSDLLGEYTVAHTGTRFPLLVKLLDCAQWLSLQVHPDNFWAERLEGPGHFGKTEAWHILEANPQARLVAGIRPGADPATLSAAIGQKNLLDLVEYKDVQAGDTIFMPSRTIHALGPGLLVYEVQQTSDFTYRVYDWDRPQTGQRVLHIDKARAVVDPEASCQVTPLAEQPRQTLVQSQYFTLEHLHLNRDTFQLDTHRATFHALTVIDGQAEVEAGGQTLRLNIFESVVVPAVSGAYRLTADSCRVLKASVEP